MQDNEITTFAETNFRNNFRKFGIKTDDRRRHMYLIGKTGMGKSTVLENMIINDIRAGHGVAVVDPHGDLAEKIIEYIPANRINDVVYFNPADIDFPIAFNVIEHVEPHLRHLVASGLIGVFQKLWADSWGPRLEYILRNAILAILDYPDSTLLGITRILSDKAYRKKVVDKIQNPVVKAFWVNEFASYADKFASEAVSPIQNKVGQFLSSSLIRNIVGQVKSAIDLRDVMDQRKILILNLSKGRIGEDNSSLLGAMMITKIQLAAMSRVDILEKDRKDFYLYIDEFQNFTTDSFANILSEARKYRLNLIMAHQYIEQLGEKVKPAVFGNVGSMIVFRVGAIDAEELVKEFIPVFIEEDLVNLPKYEFYIKLMIDGITSDPFSARGLAPFRDDEKTNNKEKVIKISREKYAKDRETVEDKIARWHTNNEMPHPVQVVGKTNEGGVVNRLLEIRKEKDFLPKQGSVIEPVKNFYKASLPEVKQPLVKNSFVAQNEVVNKDVGKITSTLTPNEKSVFKFEAVCSRCGKLTNVSFKPDGIRPIFCKECLTQIRLERQQNIETKIIAKKEDGNTEKQGISLQEAFSNNPINFSGKKVDLKSLANKITLPANNDGEQALLEDKDIIIK
ncbi:type IV secretion system DNA-binding domain-containing protein [Patescibacteria group bacterium]|nr:type IV secretion system DNA-binding domain-containing protein [Patescibacteria group bacterium]MBU0879547.1 type IV secretion system DNA-binding domain-containing protein [Patescibacteria group bacterium]MBU0880342.1 type IV secretion system DNA-binding domain-containing protein [Patescibacteria group bacterium]MBU0897602.1 type IV secretion system DNA-binding domain-containing protein [Patescibacteria group bacterium]MBU1062988.1 type IV secretion system DNA-binding domain-containing prote